MLNVIPLMINRNSNAIVSAQSVVEDKMQLRQGCTDTFFVAALGNGL